MRFVVPACWLAFVGCGFQHGALSRDASEPSDVVDDDVFVPDADLTPLCFGAACRRRTLAIDPTKIAGGPHVDFPMLVQLASDPDLAMHALADGRDIVFVGVDGTKLADERVRFIPATGELIAWVLVPSLAPGTRLYMYYGDPSATDQQNAGQLWSSFQGVWHLEQTTGGTASILDSTSNANHGTPVNTPGLAGATKIGNAVTFDGVDERIRILDSASLDTTAAGGTFGLWINWTTAVRGDYQRILMSSNTFNGSNNGFEWSSQPAGAHYFYPAEGPTNNYILGPNPFTNLTWHYLVVTFSFANNKSAVLYVDGAPMPLTSENTAAEWTAVATPADWLWGGSPNATLHFAGSMDELRVTNVVRSTDWIATEYENQSAPSVFCPIGPPVTQ